MRHDKGAVSSGAGTTRVTQAAAWEALAAKVPGSVPTGPGLD